METLQPGQPALMLSLLIVNDISLIFFQASALNHYESAGPMGGMPGGRPSLGGGISGGPPNSSGGNGSAAYHMSTLGRSSSVRGRDPLLPTSSGSSVSTAGSGQSGGLKNHAQTAKVVDSAYGTTRSSKKVYL